MKIHLIGGQQGSGKSTSIANACKLLGEKNIKTSVIKDDQVAFVMDASPAQKTGLFAARVTGGCSCCSYNQLDVQIGALKKKSAPDVIFAEYSGTCTNLAGSLLKPLLQFRGGDIELANFSTFADARVLLKFLKRAPLGISPEAEYTFKNHVEEADILVVNKMDLLTESESMTVRQLAFEAFPKLIFFQNSLDRDSLKMWIEKIGTPAPGKGSLGGEETAKAWLDEELRFSTADNSAVEIAYDFMKKMSAAIAQRGFQIENLKYLLSYNKHTRKLSYTDLMNPDHQMAISEKSNTADLMIHASIVSDPGVIRKILFDLLKEFREKEGLILDEKFISH